MNAGRVIRFARVDFRNDGRVFGIKDEDRFSHLYIIGKTGTGKSTLIETMALQDLERGNGFALIDPHGDLVARIAARHACRTHRRRGSGVARYGTGAAVGQAPSAKASG